MRRVAVSALLLAMSLPLASISWAQFTANHVLVLRVGDGAAALTTAATPVFIDEFQSDGTPVRTISLPTAASGSNVPVTLAGSASSEGALSLTTNGSFLVLAGYATPPGTASVGTTTSAAVNRVIARIDGSGAVNASTLMNDGFSGGSVRAATSVDGSAFWASGNSSGASGGVRYVSLGSTGSSTQILANPNNCRVVQIAGSQLFGDSGTGSFTNVFTVGTGTPTTAGQTATTLAGFPTSSASPYGFAMNAAKNICYVADDRMSASGGGIQKWVYDSFTSTWLLATTFTGGLTVGDRGVAVDWSGTNPKVYATSTASPNQLFTFVDDGGAALPTFLATAAANTIFRGVVVTPGTVLDVPVAETAPIASLAPIRPNPCHASSVLEFSLPRAEHARLELFDALGRHIAVLVDSDMPAGRSTVAFDARRLPTGMYLCVLHAGADVATRKLLRL